LTGDGTDTINETGGTDRIVIGATGAAFSALNFLDNDNGNGGSLVIQYNGGAITVTNHYLTDPGPASVETVSFGNGSYGAYSFLGAGDFTIGTDGAGARSAAAGVNTVLAGEADGDNLNGNTGNDLLFGNAGNDTLVGGDGDDLLVGGLGLDIVNTGAGADVIRFSEPVVAGNQDTIGDYTDADTIDLTDLLDASFGGASVVSDFVRLQASGTNILVQVDTDGGANSFATVATLTGYNSIGNIVTTYFEGAQHQLPVT
jgi:Ca2+-binding RTX toxin-like protein